MKFLNLTLVLLFFVGLRSSADATDSLLRTAGAVGEAAAAIETADAAITTTNHALDLWHRVLNEIAAWSTYNETMKEMDNFQDSYSNETAKLISEVKTLLSKGKGRYVEASEDISGWCGVVEEQLDLYIQLFNEVTVKSVTAQKDILVQVLKLGITKMELAKDKLHDTSSSFDDAVGKLTELGMRFDSEFTYSSDFFKRKVDDMRLNGYGFAQFFGIPGLVVEAAVLEGKQIPELETTWRGVKEFYYKVKGQINETFTNIDAMKAELNGEVRVITEMEVKTENTKIYVGLDPNLAIIRTRVMKSATALIKTCQAYLKDHEEVKVNTPKVDIDTPK